MVPHLGKNKSNPSWSHLTKMESRFGFSTSYSLCLLCSVSLLYQSASVPIWRLTWVSVLVLLCLSLCVFLCCKTYAYVTFLGVTHCLSVYNKGFCNAFIKQHRKHHMGKEWDTLQNSLTEFYKSRGPTDPQWLRQQAT